MNQKEIAKLANVSSATVSRVVNNDPSVSEETTAKVRKVIVENGYVQNAMACNLRTSVTKTIGYLVPDIKNPFFTSVLAGFEEMCFEKGYDIIFENTNEDKNKEIMAVETIMRNRVDGLLAVFVDVDGSMERLKNIDIPLVLIDRTSQQKHMADCLLPDNKEGIRQIVEYLASLGHRDIAFLYGETTLTPGIERFEGFVVAMKEFGIDLRNEYMVRGHFTEEGAYQATEQLLGLEKRPTAIIGANNLSTIGAYKALVDNGVCIPDEMCLIGFDDFAFANYLTPPITVIKRPATEWAGSRPRYCWRGLRKTGAAGISRRGRLCCRRSCWFASRASVFRG